MVTLLISLILSFGSFGGFGASGQAPQTPGTGHSDDVAAIKSLYASAAYEEALTRVSDPSTSGDSVQLAQYRALCLLALGRTDDADRAFTALITDKPLYAIAETEFSPKIVSTFHTIRKRVLPGATRALYARAKSDYDGKNLKTAAEEFRTVLTLLTDPDMAGQDAAFADLKTLSEGFMGLATAALAEAEKAAHPPTAPPPTPVKPADATPAQPSIFTAADKDVTPPIQTSGRMPEWNPTTPMWKSNTFRGVLELVIDDHGLVQSAVMRQQVPEKYDERLIAATKDWRFKPAQRNGAPVAYRTFLQVVLQPKG
jgi:hypothetical protein